MKVTNLINLADHREASLMDFANEINRGLSARPKHISSKFLYDESGSRLFQEITKLDEYYVTKAELEILENIKQKLPEIVNDSVVDIIELGVGDGHKTKIIIDDFLAKNIKVNFYPIDISSEALKELKENITESDQLFIHGIVAEYAEGLRYVRRNSKNRQIVLFLGSNIGNFTKEEGLSILNKIRTLLNAGDYLLVGFDLIKDQDILLNAYSDKEGITAQFNLNLLTRINVELGGNFDLQHFRHVAIYNPSIQAMESYLISLRDQDVSIAILDKTFHFHAMEPIHMEYSFKYQEIDIEEMSFKTGFTRLINFKDQSHYFIDSLWQV